jgi:predicted RNase H-like nuclease (RuvC/YqgF family)
LKDIVGQQKKTIEEINRFKNDLIAENESLQKKIDELKSKQESVSKLKERLKALETSESVNSKVGEQERTEVAKMKKKVEKYKRARTMVKDENEMLKLQLGAFSHIQQSLDAKQSRATIQVRNFQIRKYHLFTLIHQNQIRVILVVCHCFLFRKNFF